MLLVGLVFVFCVLGWFKVFVFCVFGPWNDSGRNLVFVFCVFAWFSLRIFGRWNHSAGYLVFVVCAFGLFSLRSLESFFVVQRPPVFWRGFRLQVASYGRKGAKRAPRFGRDTLACEKLGGGVHGGVLVGTKCQHAVQKGAPQWTHVCRWANFGAERHI